MEPIRTRQVGWRIREDIYEVVCDLFAEAKAENRSLSLSEFAERLLLQGIGVAQDEREAS